SPDAAAAGRRAAADLSLPRRDVRLDPGRDRVAPPDRTRARPPRTGRSGMTTVADPSTWESRAAELSVNGQAIIANRSVDAHSGETFEKRSPVDGRVLGTVAACDAADVDDAVQAARKAFEDGVWSEVNPRKRKRILLEYAQRILDAKDELALISTLEMGK